MARTCPMPRVNMRPTAMMRLPAYDIAIPHQKMVSTAKFESR